jgi:hypothetical protein
MIFHHKIRNRFAASGLHFLFSLSVFALLVGVLLQFWYPSPYFSASGGWQGLRLVAVVDLVLGPLITLVIFNPQKSRRELSLDIGVVVLIQMAALLWGIKAVYEQRPVAAVFFDTSFYTVPADAIMAQGIDLDVLDEFGEGRPVFVYARRPDSGIELERFQQAVEVERIPPHEQVWLYQPLAEHFAQVRRSSLDVEEIMNANPVMKAEIEQVLADAQVLVSDLVFLGLTSRYRNILLIFDGQGGLVGTVNAPYKTGEV